MKRGGLTTVSLFSGAGGLDLGLEAAGFSTLLCVECDDDARATLRKNRPWNDRPRTGWRLSVPGDIHALAKRGEAELLSQIGVGRRELHLLAGGPPCQPFSKSGYWARGDSKRLADPRADTLKAYLHVVQQLLPHVVLLENVRGLAYQGKDEGLNLLRQGLEKINRREGTRYDPNVFNLNAADFGVPQHRERTFLVASVDGASFIPPSPTHGDGLGLCRSLTAWDALGSTDHLEVPDELRPTGKWAALLPTVPEGQNYLWHTSRGGGEPLFGWRTRYWSFLLKLAKHLPAWTIQAGPGPATGPFHWHNRLLSTDELLRLQTFPDGYEIVGDRRSAQRQVGNAVPSLLAEVLGHELCNQFFGGRKQRELRLAIPYQEAPPAPAALPPVPVSYLDLRGAHGAHPGEGLGPGAIKRSRAARAA